MSKLWYLLNGSHLLPCLILAILFYNVVLIFPVHCWFTATKRRLQWQPSFPSKVPYKHAFIIIWIYNCLNVLKIKSLRIIPLFLSIKGGDYFWHSAWSTVFTSSVDFCWTSKKYLGLFTHVVTFKSLSQVKISVDIMKS